MTSLPTPPATSFANLSQAFDPPTEGDSRAKTMAPIEKVWRIPLLRLRVNDVSSEGSTAFFTHVNTTVLLKEAVAGVLNALYTPDTIPTHVRSVTLVLRSMGGIAYTTGSEIDDDHKEIHFSTDYIGSIPLERVKHEILGVVRHEMVHCWQYNGFGTCPGGLIEGIADYVRLRDGFSPPHWTRGGKNWDEGYQHTAYFLEWCEQKYGPDFVKRLNGYLKDNKYSPKIWKDLSNGLTVQDLWREYKQQYRFEACDVASNHSHSDHNEAEEEQEEMVEEDEEDGRNTHNKMVKCESSEDESVDVVGREEANEDSQTVIRDNEHKLGLDHQDWEEDWLPEEKEALFLRHRLQKTFLPNDQKPKVDEFGDADTYFTFLESMEDVPASVLQRSKLPKVLKFISRLEDPVVNQSPYNFKARARALVERWTTYLPKDLGEESPNSSTPPQHGQETLNFLAMLDPSLRRTILLEQKEEMLRTLPVSIQNEANALRRQAGLHPLMFNGYNNPNDTALVQLHRDLQFDGADDVDESEDEGIETEYEQSYISTTHESTIVSCESSGEESDSQESETVHSHSRESTQRGCRQPVVETHDHEGSTATSSSGDSTWHTPTTESQIAVISRKKLANLKFSGDIDGARFIKEFEKLVDKVQPDMSDDDKRMLLTTSFTGEKVNIWYEELDVDDSMPYEELKGAFIETFKGNSRRGKKLEGGALLDF